MATLIDSSLWIDLSRARSPRTLKAFIAPYVNDPQACVAEPIALHHAAELVTFDAGFQEIGRISGLPVALLKRPKA
jgi:predicted nucleic acid-binding protein